MTRDDIIRLAQEAGWEMPVEWDVTDGFLQRLERFAALVAAEKDREIERLRDENVYLVNFPRCSRCDSSKG